MLFRSPASDSEKTTVPADPVKPLIHSLLFQWEATYSLRCGSDVGTMRYWTLLSWRELRKCSILDAMLFPIFDFFCLRTKIGNPCFCWTSGREICSEEWLLDVFFVKSW